jgi:hypothetical protein
VIAALYVQRGGVYYGLPDVDPWDESRDARLYAGPWPVVAHPPCARWGKYWSGGPSAPRKYQKGDDGGCFATALGAVQKWGGVIEHPAGSYAWVAFGLGRPPSGGSWVRTLGFSSFCGGWTCCVDQGQYGHRAQKRTWLYACGFTPLPLRWGPATGKIKLDDGFHSTAQRRRAIANGYIPVVRMSDKERKATPPEFRDLLLDMARLAGGGALRGGSGSRRP